jgi:hypothetical protein
MTGFAVIDPFVVLGNIGENGDQLAIGTRECAFHFYGFEIRTGHIGYKYFDAFAVSLKFPLVLCGAFLYRTDKK